VQDGPTPFCLNPDQLGLVGWLVGWSVARTMSGSRPAFMIAEQGAAEAANGRVGMQA
jgi:hypothetical protein